MNASWSARSDKVFIGTYNRFPVMMVKGEGVRLWDADDREYMDFLSGIAVCALGHCHPKVVEAITRQAQSLIHVSNLFHIKPQIELAELLVRHSFAEKVFFANSGAEANEAAIKLARIHSKPGRYEIISLAGSFHGRTLATVAATAQEKFHKGFEPIPKGFVYADFGSPKHVEALISEKTCAILCEPVQGEGGVRPMETEYLKGLRELCDQHGILLIYDEIQCGLGRTGTLFAHEQSGVFPDIMTSAKGLGGGLPIGAMLTTDEIAASMTVGTHASTFGGNPVAAASAVAVMEEILAPGFLESVQDKSRYFISRLELLAEQFPHLATGARGRGLLLGLVLTDQGIQHGAEIVEQMFKRGVLMNFAANLVLRFIPPLIVTHEDIDMVIEQLKEVMKNF